MDGLSVPAHGFKLLSGTANRPLAEEIARQIGVDVCKSTVTRFSDGEIFVRLDENIRGPKANILDKKTSDEISRVWIDLWEDRHIRCAILTGAGDKHFCGGHNLAPRPDVTEEERHRARLTVVEKCPDDAPEMQYLQDRREMPFSFAAMAVRS